MGSGTGWASETWRDQEVVVTFLDAKSMFGNLVNVDPDGKWIVIEQMPDRRPAIVYTHAVRSIELSRRVRSEPPQRELALPRRGAVRSS
jgi:hypothetical protein